MVLATAHRRERERRLPRIFCAVLTLIGRIPALRSVLAHITTNPHLSPLERRRAERQALRRRHERELLGLERRKAALGRVEQLERASAMAAITRQIRAADHKAEMFAVNAHDITAPRLRSAGDEHPLTNDLDPAEAQVAREHALFHYGLTPFLNQCAGVDNPYRAGGPATIHITTDPDPPPDDEPLDPIELEIAREHALLQYGLTPYFNSSAGVPKKHRSEDRQGLDLNDPHYHP